MSIRERLRSFLQIQKRNKNNSATLEEAAVRLTRARFTLEPPRSEFQAKLLERMIRERRRYEPSSMLDRTSRLVGRFIRSLTAVPLVASVLVLAMLVSTLAPLQNVRRGFSELIIPAAYASDNFAIEPTAGDRLGVASSTSFVITSKQPLERQILERALKIVPAIEYDMVVRSSTEFVVTPRAQLSARTLYRIMIDSAVVLENGITVARPFSFAFEVKEKIRVISSVPGDKTTNVPVTAAIEFILTHDRAQRAQESVRVSPAFAYTVETKGRKIIVKPQEKLKKGTMYTVTLAKGLSFDGSNERLVADHSIAFETERAGEVRQQWYLGARTAEFLPTQKPSLPLYGIEATKNVVQGKAVVYRFASAQRYAQELETFDRVPSWSWVQRENYLVTTTSLKEYGRFDLRIEKQNYDQYVLFPSVMNKGWYVADITIDGTTRQLLFQVGSWGAYSVGVAGKAVVWMNDLEKKTAVSSIPFTTVSGTLLATSDVQGLTTIDLARFTTSSDAAQTYYSVAGSGGDAMVVELSTRPAYDVYGRSNSTGVSDYWHYITTDRDVYQPGDTLQVWGFVKPRRPDVADSPTVRIKLTGNGSDWYGNELAVFDTTVPLRAHSFATDFSLAKLGTGYYGLQVYMGETLISSRFIRVEAYEKPLITLQVEPSTYALEAGKPFSVAVSGAFFDGTPASRVMVAYEFQNKIGTVTLDDAGRAVVKLVAPFGSCATVVEPNKAERECYLPQDTSLLVRTRDAEYGEVSVVETMTVFGARVFLRRPSVATVASNTVQVSTTLHTVTLAALNKTSGVRTYDEGDGYTMPNFLGPAVPGAVVDGVLTETEFITVANGTVYNAYTKHMEEQFRTVASSSVVQRFSERTNSEGRFIKRFNTKPGFSYDLQLRTIDERGFPEYSRLSFSGASAVQNTQDVGRYQPYGGINLELAQKDKKFVVGEEVVTTVKNNQGKSLVNLGRVLYVRSNGRYVRAEVRATDDYSFVFSEDDVPSTYVVAARFDGNDYETTYGALAVPFNADTKKIMVSVEPSQSTFAPGEQAKVTVRVSDRQGKPVESAVNLKVIDEAYYAFNPETTSPLERLYADQGSPFSQTKRTHEFLKLQSADTREGFGGCFVGGTQVLMADGQERSIEQLRIGDRIKTFSNPLRGTYAEAEVERTFTHVVHELVVVNGTLQVTPEHRMFINSGWQTIGSARVGDVLVSADGRPVVITSLEHVRGRFTVYNISVKDYHTFIAGGYFVHNDKDGDRTNFVDTAASLSAVTDARGEAVFTFTLPDSITSWRATAQAITEHVEAGVSTTPIIVTKPVFVQPILAASYVAGDKPLIGVRAYGTGLSAYDSVQLGIEAPTLGIGPTRTTTTPFTPWYVALPQLSVGTYMARFTAATPRGNDGVKLPVRVHNSRQRETVETLYAIESGTRVGGSSMSPTTITVMDKERGSLYAPLVTYAYNQSSDRVDDRLAHDVAIKTLQTYFNESIERSHAIDWSRYQTAVRGVALLPYGAADPYVGMIASIVAQDRLDVPGLVRYWYDVLNNESTPREQVIQALAGLAALSEPVLLPIRSMAMVQELTSIERAYVALAASMAGDEGLARSLYHDVTEKSSTVVAGARSLSDVQDENIVRQSAAALALVGARLNDATADEWVKTLDIGGLSNPDSFYMLEHVLYLTARLPYLKTGEQTFTITRGLQTSTHTLTRGQSMVFTLNASESDTITFGTSTGNIAAVARTERPIRASSVPTDFGIRKEYMVNGVPTTTFSVGDMVEVRLYPQTPTHQVNRTYYVRDIIPSGLSFFGRTYSWYYDIGSSCLTSYPYAVEGQEVQFFVAGDWKKTLPGACSNVPYLSYKARVRGPGIYVAEPSLIQSFVNPELRGYGASGTVIISTSTRSVEAVVPQHSL